MRHKYTFLLLAFFSVHITAAAQQVTVSGRLKDVNTRREVGYATVFVKGSDVGVTSDFAGKFTIRIPAPINDKILLVQHVSYEKTEVEVSEFLKTGEIYLQPRVIPMKELEVVGDRTQSEIKTDIPQTISTLEAKSFDLKGYVDAGDLLRIDHSVQIGEELNGKKTISIRGGNPDEVVVMYNGVKMNSSYDNIFDLSLLDLENVEKLEVVKGSTTSLYGSEALSGVLNIVPKTKQDYTVRFQQRLGSYGSGNWGLHLFHNYDEFSGSYSYGQGGQKRKYSGGDGTKYLLNESSHQSGSFNYEFGESKNVLGLLFSQVTQDYKNQVNNERTKDVNQLISARYEGSILSSENYDLSASYKWLDNTQKLSDQNYFVDKLITDNMLLINLKKSTTVELIDLIVSYQFEKGNLDYKEIRDNLNESNVGIEKAVFSRNRHAVVGVAKIHNEANSDFFQTFDIDLSLRRDQLTDTPNDLVYRSGGTGGIQIGTKNYSGTIYKISTHIAASSETIAMDIFANVGTNIKFPTLIQQMSIPGSTTTFKELEPEKNNGMDINFVFLKETKQLKSIDGLQLSLTYLKNEYDNKIRSISLAGIPTPVFDNVPVAKLSGYEGKFSAFLFGKKLTTELGFAKYIISDLAAFPFKSDLKTTFSSTFEHDGYSAQVIWFYESEQLGWVKTQKDGFKEYELPSAKNVDLHFSKQLDIWQLKMFGNFSVRNLLNDSTELEGLALRDRRFYLTFGAQF